ncbi:MAG: Gfo/Idh/MocA family oxidoreductase, partial [SAR202 cluster bacterium]|nr:Gfo/Idh/MocA family oxidoreductase [SAR202 cluster bacterium]
MTRVRIGVIGCGAIAQIQHLPFLTELAEEFEVLIVCGISPSAAKYVAELFHVPRHTTDYREVLES